MEAQPAAEPDRGGLRWRVWALVPAILLVAVVSATISAGSSLTSLVGHAAPPADEFDVRRVEFAPGEIRNHLTNPQRQDLTLAQVTVDHAIVPFTTDGRSGSKTLARLRSTTVTVPLQWVEVEDGVARSRGRVSGMSDSPTSWDDELPIGTKVQITYSNGKHRDGTILEHRPDGLLKLATNPNRTLGAIYFANPLHIAEIEILES